MLKLGVERVGCGAARSCNFGSWQVMMIDSNDDDRLTFVAPIVRPTVHEATVEVLVVVVGAEIRVEQQMEVTTVARRAVASSSVQCELKSWARASA